MIAFAPMARGMVPTQRLEAVRQWVGDHRQAWIRLAVIAATLYLSVYFGQRPSLIWLFPLIGIALLVPMLRSPQFGIAILVAATILIPLGIGTGTESPINAAVILLVFLSGQWMLSMILRREMRFLPSRPILPLMVMGAEAIISFMVGGQLGLPLAQLAPVRAQIGGLGIYLLSILAFLVMAHQVRDIRWLRWICWIFLGVGFVCTADHSGLIRLDVLNRAYFAVANESVFWIWLFVIAFSQALLNRSLRMRWRLLFAAGVVMMMAYSLIRNRDWNSGWVPEIAAALVILWLARPRLAMAATFAGVVALIPKLATVSGLLFNDKNQYDLLTRTAAWDILWQIVRIDPVLGTGFANYYFYTPLYPILGYAVKFNSHNNYMDMITQTGFIGLAIFIWVMFEIARLAWRLRTRVPAGFPQAYVYGAMGGVAAMLVAAYMGDWVLPFVYNIGLGGFRASVLGWLFLGGLVVLERRYVMKPNLEAN